MARKKHDQIMDELRRETEKLLRELEILTQQLKDRHELETFRARCAAEYFNKAAARDPERATEYKRLAVVAATVDVDKMRGDVSAYKPNEAVNREWHVARDRFHDEINRAAGAHIREFAARSPELWRRLEKHSPEFLAKMKPPKDIAIKFKL